MSEKSKFGRYIGEKIAETIKDFRGVADEAAPVARREADDAVRASRRAIDEAPRPVTITRTPRAEASAPKASIQHPDAPTARTASDLERRGLIGGETGGMFGSTARNTQDAQRAAQAERQVAATQQQAAGYTPVPQQQQMQQADASGSAQARLNAIAEHNLMTVDELKALPAETRIKLAKDFDELKTTAAASTPNASQATPAANQFDNMGKGAEIVKKIDEHNERAGRAAQFLTNARNENVVFKREDYTELRGILSRNKQLDDGEGTIRIAENGNIEIRTIDAETNKATWTAAPENESISSLLRKTHAPDAYGDINPVHTIGNGTLAKIVAPKLYRQDIPEISKPLSAAGSDLPSVSLKEDAVFKLQDELKAQDKIINIPDRTYVKIVDADGKDVDVSKFLGKDSTGATVAKFNNNEADPDWLLSEGYRIEKANKDAAGAFPITAQKGIMERFLRQNPENKITSGDFTNDIIIPQSIKAPRDHVSVELGQIPLQAPNTWLDDDAIKAMEKAVKDRGQLIPSASRTKVKPDSDGMLRVSDDADATELTVEQLDGYLALKGNRITTADLSDLVKTPNRLKSPDALALFAEVERGLSPNELVLIQPEKLDTVRDGLVSMNLMVRSSERTPGIDENNILEYMRDASKITPTTADYDAIVVAINRAKTPEVVNARIAISDAVNSYSAAYKSNGSLSQTFMSEFNKQLTILGTAPDGGRILRNADEVKRDSPLSPEEVLQKLRKSRPISHKEFEDLSVFAERRMPWKGKEPPVDPNTPMSLAGRAGGMATSVLNAAGGLVKTGERKFPTPAAKWEFEKSIEGGLAPIHVRMQSAIVNNPKKATLGGIALGVAAWTGADVTLSQDLTRAPGIAAQTAYSAVNWDSDGIDDSVNWGARKLSGNPTYARELVLNYTGVDIASQDADGNLNGINKAKMTEALDKINDESFKFLQPAGGNPMHPILQQELRMYLTKEVYGEAIAKTSEATKEGVAVKDQETAMIQADRNQDVQKGLSALANSGNGGVAGSPATIKEEFNIAQFAGYLKDLDFSKNEVDTVVSAYNNSAQGTDTKKLQNGLKSLTPDHRQIVVDSLPVAAP